MCREPGWVEGRTRAEGTEEGDLLYNVAPRDMSPLPACHGGPT